MFLLNKLGSTDTIFFVTIGIIVLVGVAVYFLIPLLKHKQYKEQIDNLHEREKAFNKNREQKDQ